MAYAVISVIVLNLVAYFMPKKISKVEMYASCLFAVLFAALADSYLSSKYHLYWYFAKEMNWSWLVVLLGGKPSFTIIFLNLFPFSSSTTKKVFYVIGWSVLLTLFESGAVYVGKTLYYANWNIGYSAVLYPFLLLILYYNYKLIHKWCISFPKEHEAE